MTCIRIHQAPAILAALLLMAGQLGSAMVFAQVQSRNPQPVNFRVSGESQRLEMVVNTSRILTLDYNVPKLLVQNPKVIQASPLSPNQIQISALQAGVTSINLWDENDKAQVISVRVYGDVRELQDTLNALFPKAAIEATPLNSSILLTGHVPSSNDVSRAVEISREYFPRVINHMTVGGVQTVALEVKVMEVSRTKLREFGVDWNLLWENGFLIQSVSGLLSPAGAALKTDTVRLGLSNATQVNVLLRLLRQNNLAKLMAEPTLVTMSGRPASFNSGGQIPVPRAGGLGTTSVQYREFGTSVDFVPIVLGNGKIRLEVRPTVTEVDASLADQITGTPGFRSRRVDTGVEMKPGQTLALAGLIQNKVETSNRGLPWLAEIPWFGAAFRKVEHRVNEVELLVLVTPRIVQPMDPHEVPKCGPGQSTMSPNDVEFYWRGYMEVPRCCLDGSCPRCVNERGGMIGPIGPAMPYEEVGPDAQPGSEDIPMPRSSGGAERNVPQDNSSALRLRRPAPAAQQARIRMAVQPASATHLAPQRRQVRHNTNKLRATSRKTAQNQDPGLIGPIGYNVIK